jgi:hypothetical protein
VNKLGPCPTVWEVIEVVGFLSVDAAAVLLDIVVLAIPLAPNLWTPTRVSGRAAVLAGQAAVEVPKIVRKLQGVLKIAQAGTHITQISGGDHGSGAGETGGRGKSGGTSHTTVQKKIHGRNVRVDVEFPTGGSSGNVHVHIGKQKHFLNSPDDIRSLPKSVRRDRNIQRGIEKAFDLLSLSSTLLCEVSV